MGTLQIARDRLRWQARNAMLRRRRKKEMRLMCEEKDWQARHRRRRWYTLAMDKNTQDILDALDFIKERMASKPDIAELRLELQTFRTDAEGSFRSVRSDLAEISKRLDLMEESYANLRGVTKEIDEIRAEVSAIQKHLGIEKKIAA